MRENNDIKLCENLYQYFILDIEINYWYNFCKQCSIKFVRLTNIKYKILRGIYIYENTNCLWY